MNRTTTFRLSILLALGLSVGACSSISTVATRGNVADSDRVAEIKVGQSRMEDVSGLLGTPSQVGTFDQTVWYYIGQKTEKTAFLEPEVIDRRIVIVRFDPKGVVTNVKTFNGTDAGEAIDYVDRSTPTSGRELTFLEQLLGNVGRFATTKKGATGVMRNPGM